MTSRFRLGFRLALFVVAALLCSRAGLGQVLQSFPADVSADIVLGSDGAIWTVAARAGTFLRIENGNLEEFPTTQREVMDMAAGADGNIWFTNEGGIRRMTTAGDLTIFNYPGAWPLHIAAGPDRNMWFTDFRANRIGRITTSGQITWFDVPTRSAGLMDIAAGPDGNLWFTEDSAAQIGRISTSGSVTEFRIPVGGGLPTYICPGTDGNVWFTTIGSGVGYVGRITPAGEITEYPIPFGANSIAPGPDGSLWLGGYGFLMRVAPSGSVTTVSVPEGLRAVGFVFPPDGTMWFSGAGDDFAGVPGAIIQFCADGSSCFPKEAFLLHDGRFAVTVDWKNHFGAIGRGHGAAITPTTASFWFFEPANVDMVVKILDGCSINQRFWIFAAGLTDVEVNLTVTDTHSGRSKVYFNPEGTPFAPIQDAAAFGTCP